MLLIPQLPSSKTSLSLPINTTAVLKNVFRMKLKTKKEFGILSVLT